MPIKQNAKKALRQSLKKREKNLAAKVEIKKMLKDARKLIDKKEVAKAEEMMKTIVQKLDKIAKSGYFKKNKSSRLKSRLMIKINTAKKS